MDMHHSKRLYQIIPDSWGYLNRPTQFSHFLMYLYGTEKFERGCEFLGSCNKLRAGCPRQYRQLAGRSWPRRCLNNPQGTLLIDSSLLRHKCDFWLILLLRTCPARVRSRYCFPHTLRRPDHYWMIFRLVESSMYFYLSVVEGRPLRSIASSLGL